MPRKMQDILDHADELALRFESYDGDDEPQDATRLRELRRAVVARADAERLVAEKVRAARHADLSWSVIGTCLGTSGEAARQRFGVSARRT